MNEQIKDGGPAFPVHPKAHECGDREYLALSGMTLRDYFAAKAMQGDIASMRPDEDPSEAAAEIANRAYLIADAMLAARGDA